MADPQRRYVLDANIFIEAHKRYYAFDLAPGFWDGLVLNARNGLVVSIDKVYDEIDPRNQELKRWATDDFQEWRRAGQGDILNDYARVMLWVDDQDFKATAVAEFADTHNADAWVIAYALAKGLTAVTEEQFKPGLEKEGNYIRK